MEEQELKQEIVKADEQIQALVVNSPETFEEAGRVVISLDDLIKKIKKYWKEPKEKAFQAHKAITQREKEMLKPVEDRRRVAQQRISAYLTEQERKRQEEQRKLDAERKAKEDREKAKLERRAEKAEESGNAEKAEELREKIDDIFVAPAIVEPTIEKTTHTDAGTISQKKDVDIRVTDPMAIFRGIAEGRIPANVAVINESKLKQFIKLQGIAKLDGCDIQEVVKTQFRRAI